MNKKWILAAMISGATCFGALAQDTVRYTGATLSNSDYHHGQLSLVKGVHNIEIMRANRALPDSADGFGWTYNHAPNMAYWNNTFFVQYLSNPVGEHIPPGQVFLQRSGDGYNWTQPEVLFPPYKVPDGTTKEGVNAVAKDLYAVLHQRVGFFVAENGKLLTLGYYGICLTEKDSPNDGNGIGRVVREIKADGSLGPIYFIRYNHGWDDSKTDYPFYQKSKDKAFKKACDELLANPRMMQQMVEEADRDDPLIPLQKQYKAFSYYHLDDGRLVGLWKHALTSISKDDGLNWEYFPLRAPGFVNKNAKIWGQRLTDGNFATVYNPSQFRWPLALSTSEDGLTYTDLLLVHGEISTMRYGGHFKSYGPQYVRGILEANGQPRDNNMWLTYSMNKEDIWVSKVPVPVAKAQEGPVSDQFNELKAGEELNEWNFYSAQWAPVNVGKDEKGVKFLKLSDWDMHNYAVAERLVPTSEQLTVSFEIAAEQTSNGLLHIELQDSKGSAGIRLIFNAEGEFINKDGYNYDHMIDYEAGKKYEVTVKADANHNRYEVYVDGKKVASRMMFEPLAEISKVMFRTGERRYSPTIESPGQQTWDVENATGLAPKAVYRVYAFSAEEGI